MECVHVLLLVINSSSAILVFSALYYIFLCNLYQTSAGVTLSEVGILLFYSLFTRQDCHFIQKQEECSFCRQCST